MEFIKQESSIYEHEELLRIEELKSISKHSDDIPHKIEGRQIVLKLFERIPKKKLINKIRIKVQEKQPEHPNKIQFQTQTS